MDQQRKIGKAYKSPSTGQACDAAQYVAELMLTRKSEINNSGKLGYKFWNKAHKDSYQGQVVAVRRLIKQFGEKLIVSFVNSDQGKKIYSFGFFKPLDFVVEAINRYKPIFDKQQEKLAQNIEQLPAAEPIITSKEAAKPFAKKNSLFSRIKTLEQKNDEKDQDS
jgi:hypothetical protein